MIACTAARGAGYDAALEVRDGKNVHSAKQGKSTTAPSTMARRVVFEGSVDGQFTAKWKIVRTDQTLVKDELVHIYVVKMERQGQAPPALEPSRVVIESAVTMDFPAGETAGGTQQFRVDGPGIYLVRVEVGADPEKPGIEDYAELELVVK
jgi:hypothetical protein